MYSYLRGILADIDKDNITVDCNGIGFMVFTTTSVISNSAEGELIKLFVHQVIKEDEHSLYGFATKEEKSMFLRLISVSGIGPKSALSMLSELGASNIALAIVTGDVKGLTRISGIGSKTAQRLILELKGSISNDEFISTDYTSPSANDDLTSEALTAIMSLGFSRAEALKSISAVRNASSVEDIIREVLKNMDKSKNK